jgi:hypothetical protein
MFALFWDAGNSGKYLNNVSEEYTAPVFKLEKAFSHTYILKMERVCSSKPWWTYTRPQGVTCQKKH